MRDRLRSAGLRYRAALALTLAATLASLAPQAAHADATKLIRPGDSIGPARIGMSASGLVAALGRPVQAPAGQLVFPRWGIAASLEGGVAVRLSTTSPQFRTARGVGVGAALEEVAALVGDLNEAFMQVGADTIVTFPFQGIGLVFRGGRAVEVFVMERIAMGPPATPPGAPARGPQAPAPPAPAREPQETQGAAPAGVAIKGLAEMVNAAGLLRVTGQVVNTGTERIEPVSVTVTFQRRSGEQFEKQSTLAALAPGAAAPFTVDTVIEADVVTSYTVAVTAGPDLAAAPGARQTRVVPPSAYAEFARQRVRVEVQLGAPAAGARGAFVQVLLSIGETRPLPRGWVKSVRVLIPSPAGSQEAQVAPDSVVTVLVPAATPAGLPQPGQPLPPAEDLIGEPQILEVVLAP